MNNVILDSQLLSTLMSCPRLYDFRFNHRFVPITGKSNSIESGSLVHLILENYYKLIIAGNDRLKARSDSIDYGRARFEEFNSIPSTGEQYKTGLDQILDTLNAYFDYYRGDFWTPLEVEVVKGKVIYEDNDLRVLWKAKLDLVVDTNQGIYAIDHKTMKSRRDIVSLNNQFMGQCVVMNSRSMIINRIGFQTSLKMNEKFSRPIVSYTEDRLAEWQEEIVPFYANLLLQYQELGVWPANFTHCENKYGVCQFKEVCEVNKSLREEAIRMEFKVGEKWDPSNQEPANENNS